MKRYNIKSIIVTSFILLITSAGMYSSLAFQPEEEESEVQMAEKAPDAENGPDAYATLVRKVPHIGASIKTARQMRESDDHHYETFEVIICGKVVKKLTDSPKAAELMEQGEELGVRFKACGMSMNKFNVEEDALLEGLDVVPNGITRMFDLQEKGFKAVEL